eukprot:UN02700
MTQESFNDFRSRSARYGRVRKRYLQRSDDDSEEQNEFKTINFGIYKQGDNYELRINSLKKQKMRKNKWETRRYELGQKTGYVFCKKRARWRTLATKKSHSDNPIITVYNIQIQSRYSVKFAKSIVTKNKYRSNDRNHCCVNLPLTKVDDQGDIGKCEIFLSIMENFIKNDVEKSIDTHTLIKKTSNEIKKVFNCRRFPIKFVENSANMRGGKKQTKNNKKE